MSSLLKALKQQQSPLLKQTSVLDASLMANDKHSRSWSWLLWPLVLILGAVLGSAGAVWLGETNQSERPEAEGFRWGETASIESVEWEAEPEPVPEEEPEVTQSSGQQQSSEPEPSAQAGSQRQALDLSTVSPDLLQRFEAAVNDTSNSDDNRADTSVIPSLSELSRSFQREVPAFSYDSHMYRSSASQRWIELNGQRLYEGDALNQLTILRIEPQKVVLVKDSQAFSQPALEDWQP
ncbi:general secretion pathway protein GspB [Idiomarina loihiensis]|jgi:general secretion pathway protein B|uniref:General secretion pathway protein B n=1 Tax=Idiomarina loihiensis (strain ATCC BAA-735 / DSM 15497 / L2-TR) TaxID=283942 RepID=Q5QY25_IDILO|nr:MULTISPECIES: general secretion pathway protein GspB [Idiomarina]HAS21976.1 general secretion pathway protein GspB [Idiomarina loihiensis]AAV82796.1 General secretion pathway protein B [Idiomarina loihiensis L2TR]AGM36839.1 general secretion pathway protein B [Idiomarina loihiensis GSL 199]MAA62651.1 general secretion pathway protein GspB [Idiomarina sp.]MBL4857290.1 general secretion pathway protein GspB [Idiomarina sp.]|tara:strand:+ start:6781 stop:7491 length:711 start_codon:yes stop_codon:yes gene_type:complete